MSRLRLSRSDVPDRSARGRGTARARRVACRAVVLGACAAIAAVTVMELRHSSSASADPSPRDWFRLRMCESGNNYAINTGNDHYGAYQFDLPTWRSVGGTGFPNLASPAEQDARALMLYRMRGWQPWQCAPIVGLREDSDARSGRINDIAVPGRRSSGGGSSTGGGSSSGGGSSTRSSHSWPGVYYSLGDHSAGIRQWQLQMRSRGAPLTGTGQFGRNTLAVVNDLQRQNGLPATGLLGPNTWNLAWSGKYHRSSPAPKPAPKPKPKPAPPASTRKVSAPAWTGPQYYSQGDNSATIKAWQAQMRRRGAPLAITGQFGTNTLAVVNSLQQQNHLKVTGILGPVTWKAAWTGTYRKPVSAPAWPGAQYYALGDHSATIKAWQLQMHRRGAPLAGTGQFGPNTLAVVKRIQSVNHLDLTGILGPETWKLAWIGAY